MAAKKKAPAKGARRPKVTRHGATQPEGARENKQLLLRLPAARIRELRELSAEFDVSISGIVDAAIGAALADGRLVTLLSIAALASGPKGA